MKKILSVLLFLLPALVPLRAQQIKNVIVMIPDGCSTELLSIGRWLQNSQPLYIDRYIKGLVKTFCSDSPIGDSAPTGSTYATGHRSQDGFIATYPTRSMGPDGKRYNTDPELANSPMFTLLEAAKLQGKATGMAVTCFLSHATPADFLAHTPSRNDYFRIAKQMTAWPCDVFFGGGSHFIDSSSLYGFNALQNLQNEGVYYTKNYTDAQQAAQDGKTKIWGLFAPQDLEFEIDRAGTGQPSLREMTQTAIEILSQNPNGFFLMVEGSKIDWANHDNDLPASVYDFLAFDKAVGAAMDFAQKDKHTLVVVLPDHQTGGLSMGTYKYSKGYAKLSYDEIFAPLKAYKKSCDKAVRDICQAAKGEGSPGIAALLEESVKNDFSIAEPDPELMENLAGIIERHAEGDSSVRGLCRLIDRYNAFSWTTYGHNGGDVFLSMYHPQGRELKGVVDNESIAPYICAEAGLPDLDSLSREYYAPIEKVFEGCEIKTNAPAAAKKYDPQSVSVKVNKKLTLTFYPNSCKALAGKKETTLPGRCIYNGIGFYLPANSRNLR